MAKVAVYDMSGNTCGEMELSDAIFGVEINTHVMHEVVVAHLANRRQGTQSAKTRAEVSSIMPLILGILLLADMIKDIIVSHKS